MSIKVKCFFLYLVMLLSFNTLHSQSFGIIFESSSFSFSDLRYSEYPHDEGVIKHFFLNYNTVIFEPSFQLSFRIGYAWNSHKTIDEYNNRYSGVSSTELTTYEYKTGGIPTEIELKYQRYLEKDSVFEPLFGIGLGYYYYDTMFTNNHTGSVSYAYTTRIRYITKGFGQYITFGMNMHLSKKVVSIVQFKKIFTSSISTKFDDVNSRYTIDFPQKTGLNDLAISLGLSYNF